MNLTVSSNSTRDPYATTQAQFDNYVNMYVLYVIVGFVSAVGNFLTIVVIIGRKQLRESFLAQAVLALGDFCDSFAHILAGSMRLSYLYTDTFNVPMTPIRCMLKPFNPAFILTALLTGCATLIISAERFICVFKPTFYFQSPMKRYSAIACGIGTIMSLIATTFAYVVAYYRETVITNSCTTSVTVGDPYSLFYYGTNVVTFGVAIILHICTGVLTVRIANVNKQGKSDKQMAARMARQAKISSMMGVVFANIFLLQFVQNFIIIVAISIDGATQNWYTKVVGYFTLLMDISGPLNAVTYAYFNEDMRNGFKDVLRFGFGRNTVTVSVIQNAEPIVL